MQTQVRNNNRRRPTTGRPLVQRLSERRRRAHLARLNSGRVILVRPTPWWKRTVDVAVSLSLICLISPLLAAIALYIKSVSHGPVLFIQKRIGLGGRSFPIYKFRTMLCGDIDPNAEHRKYVSLMAGSPEPLRKPDLSGRLITGGTLLRKFSLDELPQLFNVLWGHMSLVGPRPDVLELSDYSRFQLRRFEVVPGMTGLWQVSGKNRLPFEEMIRLDIYYAERRSLPLDLIILARTIPVLFGANGV